MAFRLNIDAKFRPFTFQEMLAPLATDTQVHQALEQQYTELDAKAGEWERLALNEKDKDVYEQYKAYANKLRAASDNLYNKGLDLNSRKEFFNLNTAYNKEILPIAEAWNERRRQILAQQEMMAKDPTHMFRQSASNIGLREFMNNPNYDALSDNYSGALITQQAHTMYSDLKKAILEANKDSAKLKSLGLPFQYEKAIIEGATPEQVFLAMSKDPEALPILKSVAEKVVDATGIRGWNNQALLDKAIDYALMGATGAIGETTIKDYKDDYGMQLSLDAVRRARDRADAQAAAQQNQLTLEGTLPINLHDLVAGSGISKEMATAKVNEILGTLGISGSREGAFSKSGGRAVNGKKVKWFDNRGYMRPLSTLLKEHPGASTYITNTYNSMIKSAQVATGKKERFNVKDFQAAAKQASAATKAMTMKALEIPTEDNRKTLEDIMPKFITNGDKTSIREITSFNADGSLNLDTRELKTTDFLNKEGKATKKPEYYGSANASTQGLIMRFGDKMYLLPKKNFGSILNSNYKINMPDLEAALRAREDAIARFGENAYLHSNAGQRIESTINNSGADYLRIANMALGFEFAKPKIKTYDSSENANP